MISGAELENSYGRKIFCEFLEENSIDKSTVETFDALTSLYFQVNSIINISALRTVDDVYIKHYLDSVFPFRYFRGTCCDVGCGGGFPTLPLAIVTGLSFTGIDGVGKKLTLIDRAATELSIKNVKSEHIRAEDLARRGKNFDTVCARALADIDAAISFCAPLAATHGKIVLFRTKRDEKASDKILSKYKLSLSEVLDYKLPKTDIERRLFVYEKT